MAKPAHKFDPPPPSTTDERVVAIETTIPTLATKAEAEKHEGTVKEGFARMDGKFDLVNERLDGVIRRMDDKFDLVDSKFDLVNEKLEHADKRKADKEDIANLRKEIAERDDMRTRWYFGTVLAVVGLIVAVAFRMGPFAG